MSVILGLDLSITGTGLVVVKDGKCVEKKLIKSKPPKDKTPTTEIKRIIQIKEEIVETIEKYEIDMVVIEGLAFMVRNATALVQLSGLNYMVREYLYENAIPFLIVAPLTLKRFISGIGNAKKDLMLMEIYKKYGESFSDDNIADAFGLAKVGEAFLSNEEEKDDLFEYEISVVDLLKKQHVSDE